MKFLIVIDMQNDFITGSLANPTAEKIAKPIADYIGEFKGVVILTRDTHQENYLETYEGKHLPVTHCVENTDGWDIEKTIDKAAKIHGAHYLNKPTFGYAEKIADIIKRYQNVESIEFVGTVTEICVISNVLGLKPYFPDTDFIVHSDMCAGLNDEGHNAALTVMKACQIEIL